MRLNEWQYMNAKPASNSSGSFKKRFEKLIKYHIDHASSELESITAKNIKETGFYLGEHYNDGHEEFDRNIAVSFIKNTNEFIISIFVDNKEVYSTQVKGYDNCVAILEAYMFLPDAGTQEYDDLLVEWVAMKNNSNTSSQPASSGSSTSKTNKEKFTSLLYYMMKHKAIIVDKAEVVRLDDSGFTYKEHRKSATGNDFTLILLGGFGRGPYYDHWEYELYKDTKLLEKNSGEGFESFLWNISAYFNTPKVGSPEHKSLTEWVAMKGSQNSSASSNTFYKDKFKKLLDYHVANDYSIKKQSSEGAIDILSEDKDKALFKYTETWEDGLSNTHETITCTSYFKRDSSWWILRFVDGKQTVSTDGSEFNELIKELNKYLTLPPLKSSEYQDLLESASIAEDFRLYENLWD